MLEQEQVSYRVCLTCLKFAAMSVRCAKGQNQEARIVGVADSTGGGILLVQGAVEASRS
jgi:hypothetical protein